MTVKWSSYSRRQLFWEAVIDLHDGKPCPICKTPGCSESGLVGPVYDPDHSLIGYRDGRRRHMPDPEYPTLRELTGYDR